MHRLFTSRTFFEIFTIFTLSNLMSSQITYLNCLLTLWTHRNHWTLMIEMQICIILHLEFLVKLMTERARVVLINLFFIFWNFNKLILNLFQLISRFSWFFFLICAFNGPLIKIFLLIPSTYFVQFLLNAFYYLGSDVLQIRFNLSVSNLIRNSTDNCNSAISNLVIFVIDIFHCIVNDILKVFG
jgi:hypothetical protein